MVSILWDTVVRGGSDLPLHGGVHDDGWRSLVVDSRLLFLLLASSTLQLTISVVELSSFCLLSRRSNE